MCRITKLFICMFALFLMMNIGLFFKNFDDLGVVNAAIVARDPVAIGADGTTACSHTYSWVTNKKATCTSDGSMSWTCSKCGHISRTNTITKLGHDYSSSTCTAPSKCSRCGITTGTPSGHNPGPSATCTTAQICTRCNAVLKAATGHSCTWRIIESSTCTEDGNKEYRCTKCNTLVKTSVISAKGHDYSNATCTSKAKCNRCGATTGNALGHDYKFENCVTPEKCTRCGMAKGAPSGHPGYSPATCTKPSQCIRCGMTSGKALGHNLKDATCTEPKTCTRCTYKTGYALGHSYSNNKCIRCGATETGIIVKKCTTSNFVSGHTLTTEYESVSATKHVKITTCNTCGVSKEETGDHKFSEATCTEASICSVCKYVAKKALGHSYPDKVSCTEPATCIRCKKSTGKALGHDFEYKSISNSHHIGTCTRCNYSKSMEMHSMSSNRCTVCDYKVSQENCIHTFSNATCTSPRRCTKCKKIDGKALGHNYAEATCTKASACTRCGALKGKALGHDYADATCIAPKTCKVCGAKTGKTIKHELVYTVVDSTWHIGKCKNCVYTEKMEKHNIKNEKCTECGYEKEKCKEGNLLPGHKLEVKKVRYSRTNILHYFMHVVDYYCSQCKVTISIEERHELDDNGKCTKCNFKDETKAVCNETRFVDGHNVTITKYTNENLTHIETYLCTNCNKEITKSQNHKYISGVCACGKKSNINLCEHDETNWKINYENIKGGNEHWKVYKCSVCKSETKLLENHTFNEKGVCNCRENFRFSLSANISNGNQMNLTPGGTGRIIVNHNGDESINFTYASSNTEVVTVDGNGNVTANPKATKIGNAIIKVTSPFGKIQNYIVNLYFMDGNMSIEAPNEIYVSQPVELKAIVQVNDNTLNKAEIENNIKWNMYGTGTLNTNQGSKVIFTPTKSGTVNFRAEVKVGKTQLYRNIQVNIIDVTTKAPSKNMTILMGESITLNGVTGLTKVSGESVKVSGNVLTAINLGTTIFKDSNNNTYEIMVSDQLLYINKIVITVDDPSLFVGETTNINIQTYPSDATETYTLIVPDGLKYENGVITALKTGTRTIKVKTKNLEKTATITVNTEALKFKVNDMQVALGDNSSKVLVDLSKLRDEKHNTIRYSSERPDIFEVTSDGTVIPKSKGKAKVFVEVDFQEYRNGKLVTTTKKAYAFIIVIDGYSKVNPNVFVKEGTGDSKEILIYVPGSGGLCNGYDGDLLKNGDSYYTYENENDYKGDIFMYNRTQKDGSAELMKQSILERYGISSVEEFNQKGYTLNISGFSQGGTIAINMAYELKDMGFNIDTLAIFDAKSSHMTGINGSGKTGIQQVEEIMATSDINLITVSSAVANNAESKVTRELGENLQALYGDRVNVVQTTSKTHGGVLTSVEGSVIMDNLAGGIDALCSASKTVNGHPITTLKIDKFDNEHIITYQCQVCNIEFTRTSRHKFTNGTCECGKINETTYIYANGDSSTKVKDNDGGVVASNTTKLKANDVKASIEANSKVDFSLFSSGAKNLETVVDAYVDVMQSGSTPKEFTIRLIEPGFSYCGGNKDDISGVVAVLESIPAEYRQYVKIELVVGEKNREKHESVYNGTVRTYGALTKIQNDTSKASFANVELYAVNQDTVTIDGNTYDCNNLNYNSANSNEHEAAQEAAVNVLGLGTLGKN